MLIRVWNLFSYRNGCPRILRGERKLSTYYRSLSLSLSRSCCLRRLYAVIACHTFRNSIRFLEWSFKLYFIDWPFTCIIDSIRISLFLYFNIYFFHAIKLPSYDKMINRKKIRISKYPYLYLYLRFRGQF